MVKLRPCFVFMRSLSRIQTMASDDKCISGDHRLSYGIHVLSHALSRELAVLLRDWEHVGKSELQWNRSCNLTMVEVWFSVVAELVLSQICGQGCLIKACARGQCRRRQDDKHTFICMCVHAYMYMHTCSLGHAFMRLPWPSWKVLVPVSKMDGCIFLRFHTWRNLLRWFNQPSL